MPSSGPSGFGRNEYYSSHEEYLHEVAEAMREEYLAIVAAGFILQVDDPFLIDMLSDPTMEQKERERLAWIHVEALNHALREIPPGSVRHHTCYGLNHGPRMNDIPLIEAVPFMLAINAGAHSFEVANPRHYHEWRIWEDVKLPDDKILIPGLIGHATNYVEHPELIADYIVKYAGLVGRENVIAGADCGFSSRASVRARGAPDGRVAEVPRAQRRRRPRHQDPLALTPPRISAGTDPLRLAVELRDVPVEGPRRHGRGVLRPPCHAVCRTHSLRFGMQAGAERAVTALAASQHGAFGIRQAAERDVTEKDRRVRVDAGSG